jgi:hypothetical protein
MNANQYPPQENNKSVELFLLLVGVVIAWPALLVGVVARWQIRRLTEPSPYWVGAGIVGALGALLLATRENPSPFLFAVLHDVVPLALHTSSATLKQFLLDALPLWARSLLLFPWCTLILELFSTKNLQTTLLTQERQRRATQARKSQSAARRAAKAPDQINGKAVLGALIDNPNE